MRGHQVGIEILHTHHLFQPPSPVRAAQPARFHASMRSFADAETRNGIVHHHRARIDLASQPLARARSRVQTLAASPKSESLASRTASASPLKGAIGSTGPNVSVLHHTHAVIDVGQHGGCEKCWSKFAQARASGEHARAALPCVFHVRFHDSHLPLVDHGANFSGWIHAITDAKFARFLAAGVKKRGIQTLMHVAAFDRKARLACVHKRSPDGAARSHVDVGVFEHEHRVFAAKFQHHRKQALGGDLRDSPAGCDTSREDQLSISLSTSAAPVSPSPGST